MTTTASKLGLHGGSTRIWHRVGNTLIPVKMKLGCLLQRSRNASFQLRYQGLPGCIHFLYYYSAPLLTAVMLMQPTPMMEPNCTGSPSAGSIGRLGSLRFAVPSAARMQEHTGSGGVSM